jgi:hypothetical protein
VSKDATTITLSADEADIEAARAHAEACGTSLEAEFRRWLHHYAEKERQVTAAMETLRVLQAQIDTSGRRYTREERNARRLP